MKKRIDYNINLLNKILDIISCYDENYAKEQGIDLLTDLDLCNIIQEILQDNDIKNTIKNIIENYAGKKQQGGLNGAN